MTAVAIPVAQLVVRAFVTAVWVLVLSKLMRMAAAKTRERVQRIRSFVASTKK